MSEYQEEVLTGLLDLQAELRGDEPEAHVETPSSSPCTGHDLGRRHRRRRRQRGGPDRHRLARRGWGVNERLAALHARLARLEYDLAGVTRRIERIEPDLEMDAPGHPDSDVDARWRSFLDLQKIVADRLDQR